MNEIWIHFFLFLFILWGYRHCGHSCPIVPASGDSEDDCGEADGMYMGRGNKPKFSSEKTCLRATFAHHRIPHDQTQGLNPGRRDGKPATNRLSYGAAEFYLCRNILILTYFRKVGSLV
jgi:hypothetical protein